MNKRKSLSKPGLLMASASLLLAACSSGPKADWNSIEAYLEATYPEVRSISPEELQRRLEEDRDSILLLDARQEEEYLVSHLPGALWVASRLSIQERLKLIRAEGKPKEIVVYCSVGVRSANLAQQLASAGLGPVANLEGSIFRWANQGRPLESHGASAKLVHPYDETWGQLLNRELWCWPPQAVDR